jgi:hypothetical protein
VNLAHQVFVRQQETSEIEGVGVANDRHEQIAGVPFASTASTKEEFSDGIAFNPFTMANAMKWVKETFAPLDRAKVSLSAERLISSNRAETLRTLVAVGTPRLAFMFVTMRAAAPRKGVASLSNVASGSVVSGVTVAVATAGTVERW